MLLTTLADEGSMVGAAEVLRVTQPAITRAVREAEAVLEVSLFDRKPRGVLPTQFGEIFLESARTVLNNLRNAADHIDELQRVGARPVRVGTNLAGAYSLLPQALVALKKTQPNLSVSVIEGLPEELATSLARDEIDLVVGRLDPSGFRNGAHHIRLYDEPVRIVVRQDHPAVQRHEQSIEDLMDYPWILPGRPTQLRDELDELFSREGLGLPHNIIECSTILTLRSILIGTDAIAPLPMLIGAGDEQLTMLTTSLETVPRSIGITMPADRSLSASARSLIDLIVDAARVIARDLPLDE
ncbi:MAG: LysR family transcriptional regulator [Rhodococcus sp.]|nr:LysR family transcriptional regulator [Rhodococcus sp. (in: high G+C Gram-positive bacteria)]